MLRRLYVYKAKVISVPDGANCIMDIDLGMDIWQRGEMVGLSRIEVPGLNGASRKKGLAAKEVLKGLIENREVIEELERKKKAGKIQYFAEIWLSEKKGDWLNVNKAMVESGHGQFIKDN